MNSKLVIGISSRALFDLSQSHKIFEKDGIDAYRSHQIKNENQILDPGEAYNLASGVETSIFELANLINVVTGNKTPVDLRPARDWDRSGRRFGSTVKSSEKLGFSAEVGIADGLERTIEWTKANSVLIESVMVRHEYFLRGFLL